MKLIAAIVTALLIARSPAVWAGLDLAWNACSATGGDSAKTLDCKDPESVAQLFGTFQVADTIENFVAMTIIFDFESETGDLPPFWHFEDKGCNESGISLSDAFPAAGCQGATNLWGENGADALAGVFGYAPNFETYRQRGRMVCVIARPSERPVRLIPGVDYFAFRLRLFHDNASEARGRCSGCSTPLTIAWNSASLSAVGAHSGDPTPPDILITTPGKRSNCVRVNGAKSRCPVRPPPKASWDTLRTMGR